MEIICKFRKEFLGFSALSALLWSKKSRLQDHSCLLVTSDILSTANWDSQTRRGLLLKYLSLFLRLHGSFAHNQGIENDLIEDKIP
jgi:hypothetical protein